MSELINKIAIGNSVYRKRLAADIKRDTTWQRRLAELYEKFVRILSTKNGFAKMKPFPQERLRRKFERGMSFPGSLLDPDFDNMDIVVTHRPDNGQGNVTAGGYVNLNRQTKRYEVTFAPNLYGDYELPFKDAQDVRGNFDRDTFLHEMTHYLDIAKRWKDKGGYFDEEEDNDASEENEESDEEASETNNPKYYNNPLEFNAFFQSGAEHLNSYFEGVMKKKAEFRNPILRNIFALPFEKFSKRAVGWFRHSWVQHLNQRNQRAFLKRLYNLYVPLHQRAVETLEKSRTEDYQGIQIPTSFVERRKPKAPYPTIYGNTILPKGRFKVIQKTRRKKMADYFVVGGSVYKLAAHLSNIPSWEEVWESAKSTDATIHREEAYLNDRDEDILTMSL